MKVTLEFASQEEYEAFMNEYKELKAEKLKQQRKEEFFAAINEAKNLVVEEEAKRDFLRKVLFKQHVEKLSEEQEQIVKEWENKADANRLTRYGWSWGGGLLRTTLP